jgi:NAD(P)H-hydrate epimerase
VRDGVWPLVDAAQMRAMDRHTIETLGIPGDVLMESAGRAVVDVVLGQLGPKDPVVVVCGAGNNGGDGLVVARHLHLLGVPVRAALLVDPGRLRGDAAANLRRARAVGVEFEGPRWRTPQAGVLVDAIFGTGLSRAVAGAPAASIRRINTARSARPGALRVVAVDLPSGLCAGTGQPLGVAVRADVTVTLGLPKLGLALEPGRSIAGRVCVARIGIADAGGDAEPTAELWTRAAVGARLPARPRAGHKGTFGHALLVAGSEGKTGAAALAAEGAIRIGAGLVTLACPAGLNDILEIKCTEAMTAPLPDTPGRGLAAGAEEAVLALAATRDAVGMGPGMGRDGDTLALVRALAKRLECPLALDADGVFAFRDDPELLTARRAATVLTPHPGEAAELLGCSASDVNRDRPAAARRLAERTGATVLLKGAATLAASPDGRIVVNPTGGPVLASGGTGDVLLGLVAGLLAQGATAPQAAALGAYVHGAAADALAEARGATGLLAGELGNAVPAALASLRQAPARGFGAGLAISFPEP